MLFLLPADEAYPEPYDIAVLGGMDKVTVRLSTIKAPVGRVVRYGSFEITVHACDKRPPEEPPETAVLLDVVDTKKNRAQPDGLIREHIFRGWMLGSSPALSALEHPIYDVWVLDCEYKRSSAIDNSSSGSSPSR